MSTNYVYKFYGRIGSEREQLIRPVEHPENMAVELAELKRDFGEGWDLWIEKYHRVHPHTALQRRLEGYVPERRGPKTLKLRLERNEGHVEGWSNGAFNPEKQEAKAS